MSLMSKPQKVYVTLMKENTKNIQKSANSSNLTL